MRPWHHAAQTAPSRAIERGAVADTLAVLDIPPDCRAIMEPAIIARDGYRVVMTDTTGWGQGAIYQPTMLMSFHSDTDHAVYVYAKPAALGELYRATCDGEVYHVAYWPACGNISRLTLSEVAGAPIGINPHPTPLSVSEPSTALLIALGVAVWWWWR